MASLIALLAGLIPINFLAEMTRVGMLVAFTIVAIAVIVLCRSAPDLPRWLKVPGYPVTAHSRDRRLLVDHQGSSICHADGFRTLVCAALLHTRRTTNPISVWCCSADSVGSQPLRQAESRYDLLSARLRRRFPSMKVPRLAGQSLDPVRVVFDALGDDVNHSFLVLQRPVHDQ